MMIHRLLFTNVLVAMGKLRFTTKTFKLDSREYRKYWEFLHKARVSGSNSRVFWVAEEGDDIAHARRAFLFVAARERMNVIIRKPRTGNRLELNFRKGRTRQLTKKEGCKRIVNALANSPEPLRRQDLVEQTKISGDQWTLYINHLLSSGQVTKTGQRIKTVYSLAEPEEVRN